jgi:hypothetical protein
MPPDQENLRQPGSANVLPYFAWAAAIYANGWQQQNFTQIINNAGHLYSRA